MKVTVRVRPGAGRTHVGGAYGETGHLLIAVRERAVDGEATTAARKALAKALGIAPRRVLLRSGQCSRTKVFEIDSGDDETAVAAVAAELRRLLAG